jgi:hypothetical protein
MSWQQQKNSRGILTLAGLVEERAEFFDPLLSYHFQHGEIGESFFRPDALPRLQSNSAVLNCPSDGQMTIRISHSQEAMNSDFHVRERGTAVGITYPRGSPQILSPLPERHEAKDCVGPSQIALDKMPRTPSSPLEYFGCSAHFNDGEQNALSWFCCLYRSYAYCALVCTGPLIQLLLS